MSVLKKENNIITYEEKKGKRKKMEQNTNRDKTDHSKLNGELRNDKENLEPAGKRSGFDNFKGLINVVNVFLGIMVIFAGGIIYVVTNLVEHRKDIEYLKESIVVMNENYSNINENIERLTSLVDDDHEMFLELNSVSTDEDAYNIRLKDMYQVKVETVKNEEYLAGPLWSDGSIIASDIDGDIVYRAEDLYNTLILTSYTEGSNEIYFYGRFNENNRWNGKCILNVYRGDKLVSIFEGIYDDGELFTYKRVSESDDSNWIVSDRKRQGDYNSGETWIYEKTKDFTKGFTIEDVKEKQILSVDKFLESNNEKLLSYYKGNTSNNCYNDDTGNAYLVKYKNDGDVDYLFVGKFKEGYPHDDSGNAWSIGWGYADDGYYYYKGKYEKGDHGNAPGNWPSMTEEEIKRIIDPDKFNCPLNGLMKEQI